MIISQLLYADPDEFGNLEMLKVAGLLVLYITGIFAFPGFVFPTNRALPGNYYRIRNPENLIRVYNILGIKYFTFMLLFLYWGRKKNRKKYFDGTRGGLINFVYQSKQSEFGHLAAFVFVLFISLALFFYGYLVLVGYIMLINIPGNLYPLLLQRYHRIRIEKILLQED